MRARPFHRHPWRMVQAGALDAKVADGASRSTRCQHGPASLLHAVEERARHVPFHVSMVQAGALDAKVV